MVRAARAERCDGDGDWGAVMRTDLKDDWRQLYYPYKAAVRHLELIFEATPGLPNDPVAWSRVEGSLAVVLECVVEMITGVATDYPIGSRKPTLENMRDAGKLFRDQNKTRDRMGINRVLAFIENWPKQYARRRKKILTDQEWYLKILDMWAQMQKGISRKQALENMGETEATMQKHVGRHRRALEAAGIDIPKPKRGSRVKPRG
jgi:hypothetical protein